MNQKSTFGRSAYVGIQSKQPPDAQRFPAAHAGWFLKRERLSRGLALNKVAAQLKIRERHLWAIEEGVDAEFPKASNFFAIVATYAQYLEFDPGPLIEHYRSIMPAMIEARKKGPGNIIALWPMIRQRARPLVLATVVFVVAIVGTGFWFNGGSSLLNESKIAILPIPGDLKPLKKRKWAKRPEVNVTTTSSIPSVKKIILGDGDVRVQILDLRDALKNDPNVAPPLNHIAVEAELEAAVKKNKN